MIDLGENISFRILETFVDYENNYDSLACSF